MSGDPLRDLQCADRIHVFGNARRTEAVTTNAHRGNGADLQFNNGFIHIANLLTRLPAKIPIAFSSHSSESRTQDSPKRQHFSALDTSFHLRKSL
jgi:hypothetical protein